MEANTGFQFSSLKWFAAYRVSTRSPHHFPWPLVPIPSPSGVPTCLVLWLYHELTQIKDILFLLLPSPLLRSRLIPSSGATSSCPLTFWPPCPGTAVGSGADPPQGIALWLLNHLLQRRPSLPGQRRVKVGVLNEVIALCAPF